MSDTHSFALRPLALFSPSPTNPRSRLTAAEVESLAESIALHEVLQPILARPKPNALDGEPPFEIVAGHRRWLACSQLAKAGRSPHGQDIPSLIRTLPDDEVLAMQLVENIQREDLHPLDEAEHYRRMREDAAHPASVEDIAHVGKVSPSRVYERLSLLQLVPAAREVFMAGNLSLKTALQVARMPAALQAELTTHLADWGGEPMAPKAAAAFIRDRYMLRLAQAPFDPADAELLPEAGACGQCPKRTGANPQLFGDITDADTCTDTLCFAAKKAAQHARTVDELRVSGYTVLEGDQARSACTPDGRGLMPGLHALDARVPHALGDPALTVVDVLTRANAPNEHTRAIDHPNNPLVTYAVPTAELEQHLRKIKAHRSQLDKATERAAQQRPGPTPEGTTTPPAPAPTPAASGDAQHDQPPEAVDEEAHDQLVQELLYFKPPATVAGKYGLLTVEQYAQEQRLRAEGILAAAEVAKAMRSDGAEGLPPFKLAQMLLVNLLWGSSFIDLQHLCTLCGVEPMPIDGYQNRLEPQCEWAWNLPDGDAEKVAAAWLAAQEHDGKSHYRYFAATICDGMGIPFVPIEDTARRSVDECMRHGALATGTAGKPTKPSKPRAAAYRDAETGNTWSGKGLQPKWLKARMAEGKKLTDYATAGAAAGATP